MNVNGAPGETRTPDLLVRSQTLYPTELRARTFVIIAGIPNTNECRSVCAHGAAA